MGTYPISIIPDQDCCTLFTPRNPLTRARLAEALSAPASVKATTNEGMGWVGRGAGIACIAVAFVDSE